MKNMRLNVRCPLNCYLGYGHASWNIVKALHSKGVNISLFPIGQQAVLTGGNQDLEIFKELMSKTAENYREESPDFLCWHEYDLVTNFVGKGKRFVYPFFEINKFDNARLFNLSNIDHIICPSTWAQATIIGNGIKTKTSVVPCGVDSSIFYPNTSEESNETTKFFTLGKIEYRKSTQLMCQLFNETFNDDDDVEFHVLCSSPLQQIQQQMESLKNFVKSLSIGYKIFIYDKMFELDHNLATFIRSMDCGVFLTRAEGFCLPALQTLACGKQLIITDYSAHTEFLTPHNHLPVNITEFESANDGVWFNGTNGSWAKIDKKEKGQFKDHLRAVYDGNLPRLNQPGVETSKLFSWSNCADKLIEVFNE